MLTIVVEYVDRATQSVVSREEHHDAESVLIPKVYGKVIICHRSFSGRAEKYWKVEGVSCVQANGGDPTKVVVEISAFGGGHVEYLDQTVQSSGSSAAQLIKPGKVVEVDYGFIQQSVSANGVLGPSSRWVDSHLPGEMHKRRLAVVVSASQTTLQVAPVTSRPGAPGDPTRVEISERTLDKLAVYGSSGLRSWALCSMLANVSIQRVLPPVTFRLRKGRRTTSRDKSYPTYLTGPERRKIKLAVAHGVGLADYALNNDRLAAQDAEQVRLNAALDAASLHSAGLERELARLRLVEEVARSWEAHSGKSVDAEVAFLESLYADAS